MSQLIEPSEFDLIVVGTGLIESLLAAAAAKNGHSVLQIDPASHYGGAWASLTLDELKKAIERANSTKEYATIGEDCEYTIQGGAVYSSDDIAASSSQFSLDLSPHLVYGAGPMISLLLGSGAHHYTEYKLVQGTYLMHLSTMTSQPVPSTRSEIFRDRLLTPLQKRVLMRFLKSCIEAMQESGALTEKLHDKELLFTNLMQSEGLDQQLQGCLLHGVLLRHSALDQEQLTCAEALELFKVYVGSTGRYGIDTGPFLSPMYGCGELPQAFCRTAAVGGAVQVLRCGVKEMRFNESGQECTGIELNEGGQVVKGTKIAAGPAALASLIVGSSGSIEREVTLRCVAIVDNPIHVDMSQALIVLPNAGPNDVTVWALQLSHGTAVCPQGKWVVHLWCKGNDSEDAKMYLKPCLEALMECSALQKQSNDDDDDAVESREQQQRPRALFSAYFTLHTVAKMNSLPEFWPTNVVLCPGPCADVTFAETVSVAKQCYWKLFPSEAASVFPLDEGARRDEEDGENNEEEAANSTISNDVDSDDEAVQALQAALGLNTISEDE